MTVAVIVGRLGTSAVSVRWTDRDRRSSDRRDATADASRLLSRGRMSDAPRNVLDGQCRREQATAPSTSWNVLRAQVRGDRVVEHAICAVWVAADLDVTFELRSQISTRRGSRLEVDCD